MIEKLAQLDRKQRWQLTSALLVVTAGIGYLLITHGSVRQLLQANSEKEAMEQQRQGLDMIEAELQVAEKNLTQCQEEITHMQAQCCTEEQADAFLEQITSWAADFRLTPISRVVAPPIPVSDSNSVALMGQTVDVVLQGHIQDLVEFLDMLLDRPQKICITNLRVALPPGEEYEPRASFRAQLVIDSSSEGKVL